MQTKVVNLYAGSGVGKSTTASGLFSKMKCLGHDVELVTEFVKTMAWDGIRPGIYDQPYIFGNQTKNESRLYNKVNYIITDSPLLLGPIYEQYYNGSSLTLEAVIKLTQLAEKNGVEYYNFMLQRNGSFTPKGRFETESQAKEIDSLLKTKLVEWNIPYINVNTSDNNRVDFILSKLL